MEYKRLRASQIVLDPQNPRLPDGTTSDKEAINRLLDEGYNQLLALARDLVESGEVNPTELPIVIRSGKKYMVLEGNRRVAALKLLADPRLADDRARQSAFERLLRGDRQPPRGMFCAVAADRAAADHWITLRHTGANEGVGVRVWSAEQNARHRKRMNAPIDSGTLRSIAIADELTEAYQFDSELVEVITRVRNDKLTNIGRYFSGVTLSRMQLQVRSANGGTQGLYARHTVEQLYPFFKWAFQLLDERSVDAFKNDTLRGTLLNQNAKLVPDPASSLHEYQRLADHPYSSGHPDDKQSDPDEIDQLGDADIHGGLGPDYDDGRLDEIQGQLVDESNADSPPIAIGSDDGSSENQSSAVVAVFSKKRDQRPEQFLYSRVRMPHVSSQIQRLLKEARQLRIDDNFAVACVLARVILELAVSDPIVLNWSGKSESDKLADKIRACIYKLDPAIDTMNRSRQDLVQANLESKDIGVRYLHQFMHNPSAYSDPHLARRFSAAYAPLLNSIDEAVK